MNFWEIKTRHNVLCTSLIFAVLFMKLHGILDGPTTTSGNSVSIKQVNMYKIINTLHTTTYSHQSGLVFQMCTFSWLFRHILPLQGYILHYGFDWVRSRTSIRAGWGVCTCTPGRGSDSWVLKLLRSHLYGGAGGGRLGVSPSLTGVERSLELISNLGQFLSLPITLPEHRCAQIHTGTHTPTLKRWNTHTLAHTHTHTHEYTLNCVCVHVC